jgi:hypothetical protein
VVAAVAAGRNLGKAAAHGGEPPLVHGKVKNIWTCSWRIERSVWEKEGRRERKKKEKWKKSDKLGIYKPIIQCAHVHLGAAIRSAGSNQTAHHQPSCD